MTPAVPFSRSLDAGTSSVIAVLLDPDQRVVGRRVSARATAARLAKQAPATCWAAAGQASACRPLADVGGSGRP